MSFTYEVTKSVRAKRMRIIIDQYARVRVVLPPRGKHSEVPDFVRSHTVWIEQAIAKIRKRSVRMKSKIVLRASRTAYHTEKEAGFALIQEHILKLNRDTDPRIRAIVIGNQKRRWGSCSREGIVRFNYRVVHLPFDALQYLVAHELSHLVHMNHSEDFWKEVERLLPSYRIGKEVLRRYVLAP